MCVSQLSKYVDFETKTSLEKEKVRREGQNQAYRELLIHIPLGMCPERQKPADSGNSNRTFSKHDH